MPPKRKAIANVDKEPNSKRVKLMTDTTPRKQATLPFAVKDTPPLTKEQAQEIFNVTPDPLYWYRHLDTSKANDNTWYMQPGYVYEEVRTLKGKVVTSDRPCPELPLEMWHEILKKVYYLMCFQLFCHPNFKLGCCWRDALDSMCDDKNLIIDAIVDTCQAFAWLDNTITEGPFDEIMHDSFFNYLLTLN